MRHRVYGKHLGRDKNQREALFRGLVRSLLLHETITTTEAKAKAIKGLVDKLIVSGKKDTNAAQRVIQSALPQKEVNKKLIEVAGRYLKRQSGFTQMVKLGTRAGDGAMMVRMNLIKEKEEKAEEQKLDGEKEVKPKKTIRKKATTKEEK
ncbi:MAG: 50S ribosomal protein L17 [Patescibacteria group bacterium]|nr:50S ribosomal protein L17 [Patescibacteria group bacterium]